MNGESVKQIMVYMYIQHVKSRPIFVSVENHAWDCSIFKQRLENKIDRVISLIATYHYTEMSKRMATKMLTVNSDNFYTLHGIFWIFKKKVSFFIKIITSFLLLGRMQSDIMTDSIVLFPRRWILSRSSLAIKASWLFYVCFIVTLISVI